jgi:hypothetical protein
MAYLEQRAQLALAKANCAGIGEQQVLWKDWQTLKL